MCCCWWVGLNRQWLTFVILRGPKGHGNWLITWSVDDEESWRRDGRGRHRQMRGHFDLTCRLAVVAHSNITKNVCHLVIYCLLVNDYGFFSMPWRIAWWRGWKNAIQMISRVFIQRGETITLFIVISWTLEFIKKEINLFVAIITIILLFFKIYTQRAWLWLKQSCHKQSFDWIDFIGECSRANWMDSEKCGIWQGGGEDKVGQNNRFWRKVERDFHFNNDKKMFVK